jgi:hypothetical protein
VEKAARKGIAVAEAERLLSSRPQLLKSYFAKWFF